MTVFAGDLFSSIEPCAHQERASAPWRDICTWSGQNEVAHNSGCWGKVHPIVEESTMADERIQSNFEETFSEKALRKTIENPLVPLGVS